MFSLYFLPSFLFDIECLLLFSFLLFRCRFFSVFSMAMKWSIPPSFSRSMGAPPPPALLTSPRIAGKSAVFALPVGKPCLPRASGEELSAGRYVHLVMARLLFWSGAAVRLRSKGSLEREAPPGVSWDSSWLLGSSFLSLFRTCSYSKLSLGSDG